VRCVVLPGRNIRYDTIRAVARSHSLTLTVLPGGWPPNHAPHVTWINASCGAALQRPCPHVYIYRVSTTVCAVTVWLAGFIWAPILSPPIPSQSSPANQQNTRARCHIDVTHVHPHLQPQHYTSTIPHPAPRAQPGHVPVQSTPLQFTLNSLEELEEGGEHVGELRSRLDLTRLALT